MGRPGGTEAVSEKTVVRSALARLAGALYSYPIVIDAIGVRT